MLIILNMCCINLQITQYAATAHLLKTEEGIVYYRSYGQFNCLGAIGRAAYDYYKMKGKLKQ